jgi:ribonuclease D
LTTIYERFIDFKVGKGDRLTDWLQRPLTDGQLVYAANDAYAAIRVWQALGL